MSDKFSFYVKKERPEEEYESVRDYFDKDRIEQYARSKSIMRIQKRITLRALELLDLKRKNQIILDAGCGPGFSSFLLKDLGYTIVALDLLKNFITFYDLKEENPIVADLCFLPFKPKTFSAIISISAIQWIIRDLNKTDTRKYAIALIQSFFSCLKPKGRAVIQFYPKSDKFLEYIGAIITNYSNFMGEFIIDNPDNPKKRKIFLLLKKD